MKAESQKIGRKTERTKATLPQTATGANGEELLTRDELARAMKISVRTVDLMVARREIPVVRVRRWLVRFCLPDVVRVLTRGGAETTPATGGAAQ